MWQSLEDAAARLNAINKYKANSPWNLSFSWSQALQVQGSGFRV
jgi:fructose-bisphosphate aldolase class 1